MEEPVTLTPSGKPKVRRLHKEKCGIARQEHDDYADVLAACNRKLAQWEKEGILLSPQAYYRNNDWLFGSSNHRRRTSVGPGAHPGNREKLPGTPGDAARSV